MNNSTETTGRAETAGTYPEPQERALRLWVRLARAFAAVNEHTKADIARHGLTPAEFAVLEALHHKGPLLLGELQRKILVSSGGVTYLVDRLAGKGLVERRACPTDRRASYAALTETGERLIRAVFPEHARRVAHALSGLSPEEQELAGELLRKLGLRAAELDPRTAELHPSPAGQDPTTAERDPTAAEGPAASY